MSMQKKESGIYCIMNKENNKRYIGSSMNLKNRLSGHLSRLKKRTNPCVYLQNAWNKYGEEKFSIELLENVNPDKKRLAEREQHWIDYFKSNMSEYGYNVRKVVESNAGISFTEEHKKKISDSLAGKHPSKETRDKISLGHLGQEAWNKGKRTPEDVRKKQSNARKGKTGYWLGKCRPEETRRKIGLANKGKRRSVEVRKKASESRKGMVFSEIHRLNLSKALKGKKKGPFTEERRKTMSDAMYRWWKSRNQSADIFNQQTEI